MRVTTVFVRALGAINRFAMPKDEQFFVLLEEAAGCLQLCTQDMSQCCVSSDREAWLGYVRKIREFDERATEAIRRTNLELNQVFITPFDRGDIHRLVHAISKAVNQTSETLRQVEIHSLERLPEGSAPLADILAKAGVKLLEGVRLLRSKDVSKVQPIVTEVRALEREGDVIYGNSIQRLFANERDPIQLIKAKDFIVGIEKALDACEALAELLSNVVVKHS